MILSLTDTCKQSQALLTAIKEYENNKWKTIGQKVGKPAKVSFVEYPFRIPMLLELPSLFLSHPNFTPCVWSSYV